MNSKGKKNAAAKKPMVVEKINDEISVTTPHTLSEKQPEPKDILYRIEGLENYLSQEIRGGFSEVGVITYNGQKRSPGKFYGGTENPLTHSTAYRMNYDGRFSATQIFSNAFFYTSDANEKTNVAPLEKPLDKLLSVQGVSFDWKADGRKDAGVIAQELQKHIPEAVATVDGKLSVSSSTLIAYLIESIRELKNEIDELKNGKVVDKE